MLFLLRGGNCFQSAFSFLSQSILLFDITIISTAIDGRAISKFFFAAFGGEEEGVLRGPLALRQRAAALCSPARWQLARGRRRDARTPRAPAKGGRPSALLLVGNLSIALIAHPL